MHEQNVKNVFDFLEKRDIKTALELASSNCRDKLYRVICNYYLSPCGTESSQVPPYSICPKDCFLVQNECPVAWDDVQQRLKDNQFISCHDTAAFLFPLSSCCTAAGLRDPKTPCNVIL